MRKKSLFLSAVFLLLGCVGSKPAAEQVNSTAGDGPSCAAIRDMLDDYAPEAVFKETEYGDENCVCVESTTCYGKTVCSRIICSD